MATFYLRTRTGLACKKAGRRHALYIAGKDRYADKKEVVFVEDKNMPAWAKDADDFFTQADDNERANGRSYRSIVFAIPNEATDKIQWAQEFTKNLIDDKHAYRLAVHIPASGHNPHAHLMFTERTTADLPVDSYFGRKNAKAKEYSGSKSRQWLERAKQQYLAFIRAICPDYVPANRDEPKIGAKLIHASETCEQERQQRAEQVRQLREDEQDLQRVQAAIDEQQKAPVLVSDLSAVLGYQPTKPQLPSIDASRFVPSSSMGRRMLISQNNAVRYTRPRPR
jgi:MobA/MobL family